MRPRRVAIQLKETVETRLAYQIWLETLLHEGKPLDVGVILRDLIDVIRDNNVLEG